MSYEDEIERDFDEDETFVLTPKGIVFLAIHEKMEEEGFNFDDSQAIAMDLSEIILEKMRVYSMRIKKNIPCVAFLDGGWDFIDVQKCSE